MFELIGLLFRLIALPFQLLFQLFGLIFSIIFGIFGIIGSIIGFFAAISTGLIFILLIYILWRLLRRR